MDNSNPYVTPKKKVKKYSYDRIFDVIKRKGQRKFGRIFRAIQYLYIIILFKLNFTEKKSLFSNLEDQSYYKLV